MVERHIGAHALAERAAHEKITGVDDERCERDLHAGSPAADEREERVLARRGIAEKAREQSLRYGEPGVARGNAERKRDGKIAETDGKAVAQAFKIDAAAAVGMRLLHGGFFLTYNIIGGTLRTCTTFSPLWQELFGKKRRKPRLAFSRPCPVGTGRRSGSIKQKGAAMY